MSDRHAHLLNEEWDRDRTKRERAEECAFDEQLGMLSNCCGAPIVMSDLCQACKEHCSPMEEE